MKINKTPMLEFTIKRLQKTKLFRNIYVLTSNHPEDEMIVNFANLGILNIILSINNV